MNLRYFGIYSSARVSSYSEMVRTGHGIKLPSNVLSLLAGAVATFLLGFGDEFLKCPESKSGSTAARWRCREKTRARLDLGGIDILDLEFGDDGAEITRET